MFSIGEIVVATFQLPFVKLRGVYNMSVLTEIIMVE